MIYFTMVSYDRVDGGVWHLSLQQVVQSLKTPCYILYFIYFVYMIYFTMVPYDRVDGGVWHLSLQQVVQSL